MRQPHSKEPLTLRKELGKFALAYLDDIIIYSESIEQHREHMDIVLSKLKSAGIILNKAKCKFFRKEVKILGHIVTKGKVKPDPEKIFTTKNYDCLKTIKELRSFLGLTNYCRDFIVNYAEISAPLCELLKGHTKKSIKQINWSNDSLKSIQRCKKGHCRNKVQKPAGL